MDLPRFGCKIKMLTLDEDGFLVGFKPLDSGVPNFFL